MRGGWLPRWAQAPLEKVLLAVLSVRAYWRYKRRSSTSRGEATAVLKPDIVYLWHDPADADWVRRRNETLQAHHDDPFYASLGPIEPVNTLGELRYSLRSLERYFPEHGTIYVVVDGQVPSWLNATQDDFQLVQHTEIFDDPGLLPTFNSEAIESYLHRIDGLSEHFIYFNDDVFLGAPVELGEFFTGDGRPRYQLGRAASYDGPVDLDTSAVNAAHANSNRALNGRYRTERRLTLAHRPLPLRKSHLVEAEQAFPREFLSSRTDQFRSSRMHALLFRLVAFRAAYEGEAELVPPHLFEKDMHFWTNDPEKNQSTANRVDAGRGIGFCIQENRSISLSRSAVDGFGSWMEQRYPAKSRFEAD